MFKVTHLYVGEDARYVIPYCQLGRVGIWRTTWDWRDVTCVRCLGLRAGAGRLAVDQIAAERKPVATPQGDGDPRPLEAGDGGE